MTIFDFFTVQEIRDLQAALSYACDHPSVGLDDNDEIVRFYKLLRKLESIVPPRKDNK